MANLKDTLRSDLTASGKADVARVSAAVKKRL
jgi:hypothetical protein